MEGYRIATNSHDGEVTKSQLSMSIKRTIERKEDYLERTCRTMWTFTNREGNQYLFGSFCKNRDRLFVTIAYFNPSIQGWVSVQ